MTTATSGNTVLSWCPEPIRGPLKLVIDLVAIVGALTAVISWIASFISFLEGMTLWPLVWDGFAQWTSSLSALAAKIVESVGAGAHWLAERYRELVYPVFRVLFGWLPFRVPEWLYDAIFILSFVVLSYIRYLRTTTTSGGGLLREFSEYVLKSGPFMPLSAVNYVGTLAFAWILQPMYNLIAPLHRKYQLDQLKYEVEELRKVGPLRLTLARLRAQGSFVRHAAFYMLVMVVDAASMSLVLWLPLLIDAIYVYVTRVT